MLLLQILHRIDSIVFESDQHIFHQDSYKQNWKLWRYAFSLHLQNLKEMPDHNAYILCSIFDHYLLYKHHSYHLPPVRSHSNSYTVSLDENVYL